MAPDRDPGPERPSSANPVPPEQTAGALAPLVSVVIPMRNEGPNVLPLIEEIALALGGMAYEVICVDDGSDDDTGARLAEAAARHPVRVLRHQRSCGQSAGVVSGVSHASGAWIATLDGDGQNNPADIPALLARAVDEAARTPDILVAGHRVRRQDSSIKRISSRIANAVRARLLGDATPDTGCGLKVFPRALFLQLPRFDHMHRYLPALVLRHGGRVVSVPVSHRPRLRGKSNYGTLDRLLVSLSDMLGVMWLQRRWKRPVVAAMPPAPMTPAPMPPAPLPSAPLPSAPLR